MLPGVFAVGFAGHAEMQQKMPQLDAVRGLAILVVMLHNTSLKFPALHLERLFRDGWMGVDLFFVLSGFLITGILVDTKESEGFFRNFYVRRCLRIWPLYYSLLIFMFVVAARLSSSEAHQIAQTASPWWAYPLFLQNFLIAVSTDAAGPLAVTWSLAIEEQFYLVWPWIVRFCSSSQLFGIAATEMCLSPILRFYLSLHHVNLYTNVFSRLDGLMAGAILAVLVRSSNFSPGRFLKYAWISFLLAAPLAFVTEAISAGWMVYSLTALASASFIYLSLFSSQKWLQSVMTNRFAVYTGALSYGLYLLHKIAIGIAETLHLDRHPVLLLPVILVLSYALAALSWNLLEKPFLKLKRFFEAERVHPNSTNSPAATVRR